MESNSTSWSNSSIQSAIQLDSESCMTEQCWRHEYWSNLHERRNSEVCEKKKQILIPINQWKYGCEIFEFKIYFDILTKNALPWPTAFRSMRIIDYMLIVKISSRGGRLRSKTGRRKNGCIRAQSPSSSNWCNPRSLDGSYNWRNQHQLLQIRTFVRSFIMIDWRA